MNVPVWATLFAVLLSLCLAACADSPEAAPKGVTSRLAPPPEAAGSDWSGKIVKTMNSGGYSYVLVDTGSEERWVAGPSVEGLTVGQMVSVSQPMTMHDFTSSSLNRTFPVIYFAAGIHGGGGGETGPDSRPMAGGGKKPATEVDKAAALARIEGGHTVAEIFANRDALSGKTVKVRGRVAKFLAEIMGTNWLHIEDGSGSGETARIRVTSSAVVEVGDVVVVEGMLSTNKDFGAGYSYVAIIEKAKVMKE